MYELWATTDFLNSSIATLQLMISQSSFLAPKIVFWKLPSGPASIKVYYEEGRQKSYVLLFFFLHGFDFLLRASRLLLQ